MAGGGLERVDSGSDENYGFVGFEVGQSMLF